MVNGHGLGAFVVTIPPITGPGPRLDLGVERPVSVHPVPALAVFSNEVGYVPPGETDDSTIIPLLYVHQLVSQQRGASIVGLGPS